MTERLYEKEPETLTFAAKVLSCREAEGGYAVVLDRTAFFPEGGGQGADHGTLGGVNVLDAHIHEDIVTHLTDAPLTEGRMVTGQVDANRRLSMSQQHTGEHIFSGLVHKLFGYDNVGFHIGSDAVTMDFNGPMTEEEVRRVETLANEAVWANLPVEVFVPSKEELAGLTYRSKKALEGDVRIVRIPGVDTCACCGTHLARTGSVGQIKVIAMQKYKGGVRLSILCGMRALAYERQALEELKKISVLLSSKQEETAEQAAKLLEERDRLRFTAEGLAMRLFEQEAERQAEQRVRVAETELPAAKLRHAAGRLAQGAEAGMVLQKRDGGWNFALCSETRDIREATRMVIGRFGGKGGGPKDMTQGVLQGGTREEIAAALSEALR